MCLNYFLNNPLCSASQIFNIAQMDIIISICAIFGYNNIHYEIKAGGCLSKIPEDLG